jgi:hypothetical protein
VIHLPEKQGLDVRQVTGDMEGDILATTVMEKVIPTYQTGHHQGSSFRDLPLANEIFTRLKLPNVMGQRRNVPDVFPGKARMRLQAADEELVRIVHDRLPCRGLSAIK